MKIKQYLTILGILLASFGALSAAAPKVGEPAPAFTGTGSDGKTYNLSDFEGQFVVLEWLNHGCPFVVKHYDTGNMQALQAMAKENEVVWLSINSGAPGQQGHYNARDTNRITYEKKATPTAVIIDEAGVIGKLYDAKRTPEFFIINPEGIIIYHGGMDDKPTTNKADVEGAHNYVKAALTEALAGKPITDPVTRPYGCTVKYK